jgi:hypothetical protein
MLRYVVRVWVRPERAQEWAEWMEREHIPEVLASGCFRAASLWEASSEEGEFWVEYDCPSVEQFAHYERQWAPALRQKHQERFGADVQVRRSLLHRRACWIPPQAE